MNKLVSKNPVLRFKEGKKIVKAKWGDSAPNPISLVDEEGDPYAGMWYTGGTKEPLGTALIYNTEQVRQEDLRKPFYKSYFFKGPFSEIYREKILDAYYPVPLDRTNSYEKTGGHPTIDEEALPKGNSSKVKKRTVFKTKQQNSIRGARGTSHYFFGNMGGWNRSMGNNITDQESLNMIKEMGMEGKSAQDIQNKINEEFGSNAVKADNRWGNLSKAGLKALYDRWKINKPEMSSFLLKIISLLPNLDVKSITPENVSIREQIAMDGYKPSDVDLHLINISNTITNKTPTYVTADRSQTRDWMRSNGINPYSVTGAMRAAARRIRAGQADDNDKLLVKGNEQLYNLLKGYYKKGGQLPSRNIVKRFKQKNFR